MRNYGTSNEIEVRSHCTKCGTRLDAKIPREALRIRSRTHVPWREIDGISPELADQLTDGVCPSCRTKL